MSNLKNSDIKSTFIKGRKSLGSITSILLPDKNISYQFGVKASFCSSER